MNKATALLLATSTTKAHRLDQKGSNELEDMTPPPFETSIKEVYSELNSEIPGKIPPHIAEYKKYFSDWRKSSDDSTEEQESSSSSSTSSSDNSTEGSSSSSSTSSSDNSTEGSSSSSSTSTSTSSSSSSNVPQSLVQNAKDITNHVFVPTPGSEAGMGFYFTNEKCDGVTLEGQIIRYPEVQIWDEDHIIKNCRWAAGENPTYWALKAEEMGGRKSEFYDRVMSVKNSERFHEFLRLLTSDWQIYQDDSYYPKLAEEMSQNSAAADYIESFEVEERGPAYTRLALNNWAIPEQGKWPDLAKQLSEHDDKYDSMSDILIYGAGNDEEQQAKEFSRLFSTAWEGGQTKTYWADKAFQLLGQEYYDQINAKSSHERGQAFMDLADEDKIYIQCDEEAENEIDWWGIMPAYTFISQLNEDKTQIDSLYCPDGDMYLDITYGDDDGNTVMQVTARGDDQHWVPTDPSEHSGDIQEGVHSNQGVGMCDAFSFSGVV